MDRPDARQLGERQLDNNVDRLRVASTCWLTGLNGPFGSVVDPILLKTSDLGASWQAPGHLPGAQSTNPATAYALQDISCLSADSCVAVGGPDEVNGVGTVLVTSDGGLTWTRFPSARVGDFQSVSCLSVSVCAATTDDALWVTTDDGGLAG